MKLEGAVKNSFDELCCEAGTANVWGGEVTIDAADLRLVLNFIKDALCALPEIPSREVRASEAIAFLLHGNTGVALMHTAIERGGILPNGEYRLPEAVVYPKET